MHKKTLQKKTIALARALAPASTVQALAYSAFALFALYVALVVLTVYFATLQTTLVSTVRENERVITSLESVYYDGVSRLSSANPYGEGYVSPTDIHYMTVKSSSGLSLAGW